MPGPPGSGAPGAPDPRRRGPRGPRCGAPGPRFRTPGAPGAPPPRGLGGTLGAVEVQPPSAGGGARHRASGGDTRPIQREMKPHGLLGCKQLQPRCLWVNIDQFRRKNLDNFQGTGCLEGHPGGPGGVGAGGPKYFVFVFGGPREVRTLSWALAILLSCTFAILDPSWITRILTYTGPQGPGLLGTVDPHSMGTMPFLVLYPSFPDAQPVKLTCAIFSKS